MNEEYLGNRADLLLSFKSLLLRFWLHKQANGTVSWMRGSMPLSHVEVR